MKSVLRTVLICSLLLTLLYTTCDNDIVGLGQKVVTLAPTIDTKGNSSHPNSKQPGDFLFGEENLIHIDAQTEGTLKYVKVTYEWEEEGVKKAKEVFAEQDENKNWFANIDTSDIPDGLITARIEASDTADRITTSTPITYTVKNRPPFVNMLIPNVGVNNYDKVTQYNSKEFDNKPSNLPSVVMDSYISGVFDDLAGIAPGYPMIKIWKEGNEEPGTYSTADRNNAGYGNVVVLNDNPLDGWINVDDGLVRSQKGSQAGSFKYFLREHKPDGSWYDQGDGKSIYVGDYRLKLLVKDLTGKIIEWPKDAYTWPEGTHDSAKCMKLKIIDQDLPPQVAIIDPEAMYLREDFNVKAEAKSPGERYLAEMYVKVEGKKKSSEGKILLVTLDKKVIPVSTNTLKDEIETKNKIKIGKTYYSMGEDEVAKEVDSELEVPANAYSYISFVDGSYNFVVTALSESGSEGKDIKTIYIDQTPPKTEITRVSRKILDYRPDTVTTSMMYEDQPAGLTLNKAKISDYRRWTVNSTVAIEVSTTDNRGNAKTGDTNNYIKFKYLLLNSDISASDYNNYFDGDKLKEQEFSEYLYNRMDAEFFEKTVKSPIPSSNANPLIKVTGKDGAYTLTLQTREYDAKDKYKLWLYIAALDNAGNAGFQKILLNVDQTTDIPKIDFGNINPGVTDADITFMGDKYSIRFEVKDDNGLDASSVKVRFASNESYKASSKWFNLPGNISVDGLSISIDNLKLVEIADRVKNDGNYLQTEEFKVLKTVLGNENETKYIQIQAKDSIDGKIYDTDKIETKETEWRPFRIDLTYPEIVPSITDSTGKPIPIAKKRTDDNPFITPEKETAYTKTTDFTAYGDIIEQNINRIEVKIDGKTARNYTVPEPVYRASSPTGNDIAVWKTVNSGWAGELRFRVPFSYDEFFGAGSALYLQDGSHTFEINFFDKAEQYATQTITFYIDTKGPNIEVITPSGKIYLNDINNISKTDMDRLLANSIKDSNAKLIGNFTDSYSPVFSSTNYQYYYAINSSAFISAGFKSEVISEGDITENKSVTWQIPINDTDRDGVYTLSLRVKDSLGNGYDGSNTVLPGNSGEGYLNNIAYMLDRNIPQLKDVEIKSDPKNGKAGITIKGTVYDTNSISKFDISVKDKSKDITDAGSYTAVPGKEKEFKFEYWMKTEGDNDFVYGSNNVTITVTGSSGKSAIKTLNFILDDRGPEISFNTTGGGKIILNDAKVGEIVGANVTAAEWNSYRDSLYENRIKDRSVSAKLSGRFSDDYSAISDKDGKYTFRYKIDGPGNGKPGSWKDMPMTTTPNSNSVPWEIPITTNMEDGIYRLTIGVNDINGYGGYNGVPTPVNNITYGYEANMAFMLDRNAPTLDMGKIVGAVFDGNTKISFTGSVSGTYEVESLSMVINSGTPILLTSTVNGATTFKIEQKIIDTADLIHGRQNIVISVTGSSGQTRNEPVSFIVDKNGPDVTISGKSKIKESDGINAGTLTTSLNNGSINPRSWNNDVNLSKIYNERLKDNSAKLELVIYDEFSPLSTTFSYSINGESPIQRSISMPDIPWSVNPAIREGLNTLDITVSDNLNNVTTEQKIVFMVDRNVPALAVSGIKSNDVFSGKTNIPITGTVKNVYDVTRLSLVFNGEELSVQGTEAAQYLNYNTGDGGFPFSFTIPSSKFAGKHGAYTVLVNAVGSSGQSKMENYSIIIDQKGPGIDVNIPSGAKNYGANIPVTTLLVNSVKETPALLSGSFNDEYSPVSNEYWYEISGAGGSVPLTKVEGTITDSKSVAWQVPVPDNFPDGVYTLSLRVKDSWGNGYDKNTTPPSDNFGDGYINNLAFLLDRSVPNLTFNPVSLTTKNEEAGFYVIGTVTNTYKINSINIKIGANPKNETILTPGSDRSFTFDHWVKTQGDTNLVYGSNIVTISVTGSSGQSSVATQSLIIDNRGPEISFNTTSGEKLNDLTGSELSTLNTESLTNAAWTTRYKNFLYETRIKDKSESAKLSGRFSDDYTNITAEDGEYIFWYKIDGPGNVTNGTWKSRTMTTTFANSKSVPWDIPIKTDMNDGIYRLSIAVRDKLNNGYYENGGIISPSSGSYGYEANMAFMIDRTAPAISITKITTGDVFGKNKDVEFKGTVSNTYEVQKLIMSFGETTRELTLPASSGTKTFTINTTTLNTNALTVDGKQNIIFTATGSSDQTISQTISFIFDKTGPEVEINGKTKILESSLGSNTTAFLNTALNNGTNPRDWADTYLKSIYNDRLKDDSAKLTLNVKDAYSNLKTFAYKINDATETWKTLSISTTSKDASVEIPWSALGSGLNTLDIRVSDDLDNEAKDIGIVFMIDKNSPIFYGGVDGIGDNAIYSGNNSLALTGKVTGVYDVTRLSLIFNKVELDEQTRGTELGSGKYLIYADGGFPFNFTIPTSGLYGPQSVLITAVGSSGKSTSLTYNIIIDNKGPNVTFNVPSNKITMTDAEKNSLNTALNSGALNGDQQTTYNLLKTMLITDTSTKLSGTFNDEYSAVYNDTNKTFWWQIDGGAWTPGNLPVSDNKSVGWEVPIDNLGDGVHLLNIRARDKWGNGSDGTALGNGGYENNVAFMIDRSSPKISGLNVPGYALKDPFDVSGKIEDTYGIKRFSIKLGNDEIAVFDDALPEGQKISYPKVNGTITYGSNLSVTRSAGKTFDFTAKITPKDGGLDDGPVSLTFTAIGSSGQVAIGVSNFIYDTTGPVIAIGAPISESVYETGTELTKLKNAVTSGNFTGISAELETKYDTIYKTRVKDSSASFTITFTDDKSPIFTDGNKSFLYSFDGQSFEAQPVNSADYGKKSVSVKLPLPANVTNGVHSLSIRVMDSLGNGTKPVILEAGSEEGYINNLIFMIDSGTPKLLFDIDSPATINDQGILKLSGTITDTFEVQELSVKIGSKVVASKAGENGTLINVSNAVNRKEFSFNNVIIDKNSIKDATGGDEGSYTISVTVKGSSDQSDMRVDTFVLDTKGPVISINAPIKEKIYLTAGQRTDINAAITDNDISILTDEITRAKYYKLFNYNVKDVSAGLSGSFADTYSDIANEYWYSFDNGLTWTKGTPTSGSNKKSAEWKIPLTGLPEGLNRLSIRVKDTLGNGSGKESDPVGDNGDGYETNISFILDTGTPKLQTYGFDDNRVIGLTQDHYKVNGTITGVFMVKRLSVALKPPLAASIDIPLDGSAESLIYNDPNIKGIKLTPTGNKSFDFSFDLYVSALNYGPQSITINAIGSSDQTDLKILPFIFDNKGPNITINAPITTNIYLSKEELTQINAGGLKEKHDQLIAMGIKDASSGLNGYFNDEYSPIAGVTHKSFWYKFLDDIEPAAAWKELPITIATDKSVAWNIPLTDPKTPGTAESPNYRQDGIYRVSIRVKDSLGNGYDNTVADDAISGNNGQGYIKELAFLIDMGIPEITNFKLKKKNGDPLPDTNIFVNDDFIITGTILNTAKIAKLSAKIGDKVIIASDITEVSSKVFNFAIPVSTLGLDNKAYSLSVTATGSSGQSAIEMSNFTYDTKAPDVSFNSPAIGKVQKEGKLSNGEYSIVWAGAWETGEIKIGGVADDKFGIQEIWYHIGKLSNNFIDGTDETREGIYSNVQWQNTGLDTNSPAKNWSGGLYYWTYTENLNPYRYNPSLIEINVDPTAGNTDSTFYLPFYVKVVDRAGNINVVHYKVYVDPDKDIPSSKIVSPANGVRVGGEIRITGTANDNNWVHSVDIKIIDVAKRNSGATDYYYRNPGDKWVDDNTGLEVEDNQGSISGFVKAKIVGNTDTVVSWYYSINGDGKLTPGAGMSDRPVIVEVRAWDTKAVQHDIPDLSNKNNPSIVNYIFDGGIPTISVPEIIKDNTKRSYTDGIRVSGTFTVKAEVRDNGGIDSIRARLSGQQEFKEIVKDGMKTSVSPAVLGKGIESWDVSEPATIGQGSWQGGWRYYIINPGSGVNWSDIDLDKRDGKIYAKGTSILYNGTAINGSGATAMKADGTQANETGDDKPDSPNWNSQYFKYTVEFTIDSTKNYAYGKTGLYNLELDVTDNNKEPAPYNTRGSFNMGVDNFYPSTVISTQFNASTENFKVMGTAKDYDDQSGSQQGLERVLVYFSRGNKYYNARGIEAGKADTFYNGKGYKDDSNKDWSSGVSMVSIPDVRDTTKPLTGNDPNGTMANFPYLKQIGDVWQSPHAMVIDSQEFADETDTDEDGTYAEMWSSTVDKAWQARLDTKKFGDGPITVHYIVMDQAGNATHYEKEIYIGNNKPLIRSIELGTDINANGTLASDEYSDPITVGELLANNKEKQTNFRVRNSKFGLKLFANYGNGTKKYKISHVTQDANTIPATSMVKGTVYTVATAGDTEWTRYGALFNSSGITFVATGPADTSKTIGTVYTYTYTDDTAEKKGSFIDDNAEDIFTSFTEMPDTTQANGKEYINGRMKLLHDKRFIVKVYDNTVANGDEIEQLVHVALLNVDFDNDDGQKPLVTLTPFYWNSMSDNSVYESNLVASLPTDVKKREALQGHIELEDDLPASFTTGGTGINDRDPKVSGKVSFRGTAYDNIVINKIYFAVDNHSNYGMSGTSVASGTYYLAATFDNGAWTLEDRFSANGWKFAKEKETLDQDGHYIEWRLDYDSSFTNNKANLDNTLTIVAQDSKPTTPNTSDRLDKRFDIVPYITKITTRLSSAYNPNQSAFNRSARGWYPVHEDEIITIEGFNLYNTTTPNTTVNVRPEYNSANGATGSTNLYITSQGTHTVNKVFARVDNDGTDDANNNHNSIVSGYLVMRVNNIDSINNINNNITAEYNKEGNGLNNDTLNDDRAIYVWNTGYISNASVFNVSHPFMRMDNNGGRLLSYGYYTGTQSGRLKVLNNNTLIDAGIARTNRMFNTTIGVGGSNLSWYAAGSDQSSNTNRGFQFGRSNDDGTLNGANNQATIADAASTGYIALVTGMEDSSSNRFKIPRIAVQPTNGTSKREDAHIDRILMSYFDSETSELRAIYGNVGTSNVANISSTSPQIVASNNTAHKGSMYTAAGLLNNGLPVIAWYDRESQELLFSFGAGVPTSTVLNNANAIVTTPTTSSSSSGTTYTVAGHGLSVGNKVIAGTANPPAYNGTQYYVTSVNGDSFSLSTTANGAGMDIGANIYINKLVGPSTGSSWGTTSVTAYSFTFAANHGLVDNEQVWVFVGNNAAVQYYVRNSSQPNQKKFSITANSQGTQQSATECLGGNTQGNCNVDPAQIYVFRPNANVVSASRAVTNAGSWQGNVTVIDTFKGTHVDMAVDGNNNVHLAYYDVSNGGLYYAFIPAIGSGDDAIPNLSGLQKVRVDTYLSAGIKIMINVRLQNGNYVPFISYGHGSFGETRNSVRVAWRHNFTTPATVPAGSDDSDKFTGDWEVMTVPVTSTVTPVADEFVCNGVPSGTSRWAAPTGSTLRDYSGGINKTILVGYMTDKWYEGAILKKNLY